LEDANWPFRIMISPSNVYSLLGQEVDATYEMVNLRSLAGRKILSNFHWALLHSQPHLDREKLKWWCFDVRV